MQRGDDVSLMVVMLLCRGVNMYAMLTGTLPFTVEPFNLRALHQKMVDKEMNPLPPQLSSGKLQVKHGVNSPKRQSATEQRRRPVMRCPCSPFRLRLLRRQEAQIPKRDSVEGSQFLIGIR